MKYIKDLWMEDVRNITVDCSDLINDKLKKKNITLTSEQEDDIHEAIWNALEKISNGNYRHHM
jgi:hypothetical protein